MTGVVRDEIFIEHDMGFYHPESPERLRAIYGMLDEMEEDYLERGFTYIETREATREELERIHESHYIERIKETEGKPHVYLDPDTSTSPRSYEAAIKAAGSFTELALMIFKGELENGFAFARPPGHHAEKDRAMGFCIFNNVAIAAAALLENGAERVLIVDWDLHHGNGTQHSFYETDKVLYFSTHQFPYYPGTGSMDEIGSGKGRGYTVNLPLSYGCGDEEYVFLYARVLPPIAKSYKPDIILVSAGFDPHTKDPLGGMSVSDEGFSIIAHTIKKVAEEVCGGKLAITLEGGYSIEGLRASCKNVMEVLMGKLVPPEEKVEDLYTKGMKKMEDYVEKLKRTFQGIWEI